MYIGDTWPVLTVFWWESQSVSGTQETKHVSEVGNSVDSHTFVQIR